jgi:hypothetical protein
VFIFIFLNQVKPTSHALPQVVDAGEGGLGAETLPGAPQFQQWGEIFLIDNEKKFLNFEHPKLSLKSSRVTVCTRVIKLVVMVASPHLSYVFFFHFF